MYQVLDRGESVHALRRQIRTQALLSRRGRRAEELIATSVALTLVTNCLTAWNTQRLQRAVDREAARIAPRFAIYALRSIGPVGLGSSREPCVPDPSAGRTVPGTPGGSAESMDARVTSAIPPSADVPSQCCGRYRRTARSWGSWPPP